MKLAPHTGQDAGWATIIAKSAPFIRGNQVGGEDWDCQCGRALGRGLYPRQLLNILIECGECGCLMRSSVRTPGEPIPGRPVFLSPGNRYVIGGELDVADKPVAMVGQDAIASYYREVGRSEAGFNEQPPTTTDLAASLRDAPETLRGLLGDDAARLEAADVRGQASSTPPGSRHRVVRLIRFAEEMAPAVESGSAVEVDGNLLAELMTLLSSAKRWKNHPTWPALRAAFVSEAEHTLMLLAVASYLVDANNGVGIHVNPTRQNVGTADLWIEPDLASRIDLEIKTPQALRGPVKPLTEPSAIRVVTKALEKSRRQRRSTRSNLLVIGGYHLGASYDVLCSTAKAILVLEQRRWTSLAGIVLVDCTYEAAMSGGVQQFSPVIRTNLAKHPAFSGSVSITGRCQVG